MSVSSGIFTFPSTGYYLIIARPIADANGSDTVVMQTQTTTDNSAATVSNEITLGNSSVTSLRIPGLQSGASNGQVLTTPIINGDIELADAGGGGAHTLISTSTITSSTASVSFTGLTGYKHYKILFTAHCGNARVQLRVGNNSTYDRRHQLQRWCSKWATWNVFNISGFNQLIDLLVK